MPLALLALAGGAQGGPDFRPPAVPLVTHDFAGELAHNANLSLTAILALGACARLCERAGKTDDAGAYRRTAEQMAV